jgi:nicotinate-nucleotide adenylyltransferase
MRNIGLFGGTFDPPHNAHMALAQAAQQALLLDELRFIPAGAPWQKSNHITPAEHRVAMLRLALQGLPQSSHSPYQIDEREVRRQGASYTIDTVRELKLEMSGSKLFLIIGQDQYTRLHTWREWQALLASVTIAVARRPDVSDVVNEEVAKHANHVVPLPLLPISATDIRQRVASGQSINHLVPEPVARYIDQHALYRATTGN